MADILPASFHHRRIALNEPRPASTTVCVHDDGEDWLYHVERKERAAFKAWAKVIFAGGMNCKRLEGRWPSYTVRQS